MSKMKYWIKLYEGVIRDAKLARLDDHTWRRAIEFNIFAGEQQEGGKLPMIDDMAWELHTTEDEVLESLEKLAGVGVTALDEDGAWRVVDFQERHSALTSAERSRRYRQRKRERQERNSPASENGDVAGTQGGGADWDGDHAQTPSAAAENRNGGGGELEGDPLAAPEIDLDVAQTTQTPEGDVNDSLDGPGEGEGETGQGVSGAGPPLPGPENDHAGSTDSSDGVTERDIIRPSDPHLDVTQGDAHHHAGAKARHSRRDALRDGVTLDIDKDKEIDKTPDNTSSSGIRTQEETVGGIPDYLIGLYQDAFGGRPNKKHGDVLRFLEKLHGTEKLAQVINWAGENDIPAYRALGAIRSAVAKWIVRPENEPPGWWDWVEGKHGGVITGVANHGGDSPLGESPGGADQGGESPVDAMRVSVDGGKGNSEVIYHPLPLPVGNQPMPLPRSENQPTRQPGRSSPQKYFRPEDDEDYVYLMLNPKGIARQSALEALLVKGIQPPAGVAV
jgi:hypothetical protein